MLQLSRNGLRLQSLTSLDESQGSSNVKVSIQNDGTYTNYSTQLHYGYYVHGFSYTKGIARYENGVFILPREAFEQYGLLNLSVLLVSSDEELMTNQVQFIVQAAPRGDMIIDDIPSAQQQVLQLVQTTLDQYANTINLNKNEIAVLKTRMDSFTSLQQGSTTGDAELIDGRVGYDGKTYDNIGGAIRGQVSQLSDEINNKFVKGKNLLNIEESEIGHLNSNGSISYNETYETTTYIPIAQGQSITISPKLRKFLAYDETKKPMEETFQNNEISTSYTFTATNNGYIRVTYYKINQNETLIEYSKSATDYEPFQYITSEKVVIGNKETKRIQENPNSKIDNISYNLAQSFEIEITDKIISHSVIKTGENEGYISNEGNLDDSNLEYFYSTKLFVNEGDIVRVYKESGEQTYYRYITAYTEYDNLNVDGGDNNTNLIVKDFVISSNVRYVIVSLKVSNGEKQTVNIVTPNGANKYTPTLTDYLNNKKIVFCGDSFTEGDFSGLEETDYKFQDGKYKGKNKVYPYIIGLRTNANIINEAISGSTMAYINGTKNEFSTDDGRYTKIPSDADDIT